MDITTLALVLLAPPFTFQKSADDRIPALLDLYRELHRSPELSLKEERTAARMAAEMKKLGFQVTEKVGGTGVVAVLENGPGPRILVRCDMDALPVEEKTGLDYASTVRTDLDGKNVPVMHACGHDMHMTVWLGAAAALAADKTAWRGTLVFIAQPAEEKGLGAKAMLADRFFERFGKPDYALALHMSPTHPAGSVAVCPGAALAASESCDIHVVGRGGHGSTPHMTIDPIVLASRIVLGLQTIISREKDPRAAGAISVGSIHGGTKHNIIPDSVDLQLTIRSYDEAVHQKLKDGIVRTCRGEAMAVGASEPTVTFVEGLPPTVNDPALAARVRTAFERALGKDNVHTADPVMGAEDFGSFGRAGVPALIFWLGAVDPAKHAASKAPGADPLPSLHSPLFAPLPEPALRAGVRAMTAAVVDLARAQ